MNDERILVIAAHPDDETLGCGGTISRYAGAGGQVRVVFLAEGVTARYEPHEFSSAEVKGAIERRNSNAVRALGILGVGRDAIHFGTRQCCRLDQVPLIDLVKEIEHHMAAFRPTRIFTHAAEDPNVDHGLAHRAALAAARPVGNARPRAIYAFEVLSSTEWNPAHPFLAQVFFDVTQSIEKKITALSAYEDEMRDSPHPRSASAVRALARFRGAQAGVEYAEAFQLLRELVP